MSNSREDLDAYVCPSFSSYTAGGLAEIAVRVAVEEPIAAAENGGDDDFEFAFVLEDREFSAEELSYEGQIGPIFPVFNRDLLRSSNDNGEASTSGAENRLMESPSIEVPLSKLFIEEDRGRDIDPPSCSSSEADEPEDIPAAAYCVWRPRKAEPPLPNQCKKSKSTGSASRRWKLRDLMRRSNSDGKDSFVFLAPKHRDERSDKSTQSLKKTAAKGRRSTSDGGAPGSPSSAHEAFYVQNRAMKAGDKKKSYLPYRRDLVGFFANVNGLHRGFPHF